MSATLAFQPALRPALSTIYGPLDYHTQRALFERMDAILSTSGPEGDFIIAAIPDQNIDLRKLSAKRQQREHASASHACGPTSHTRFST